MKDPYDDHEINPRGDSKQGRLEQDLDARYERNKAEKLQELMQDPSSAYEAISESLADSEELAAKFINNPEKYSKRVADLAVAYLRGVAIRLTEYPSPDDL